MNIRHILLTALLVVCLQASGRERRGVVVYPSDIRTIGVDGWKKRIQLSGIDLIGIHAATHNEPLDTLRAFVQSDEGREFLGMCSKMGVDVEYELHVLQLLLPRDLYSAHPECFRQGQSGRRVQKFNMCFTCDEAYEAMEAQVADLVTWLHPTTHRYLCWTDDVKGTFCHCDSCRGYSPSEQALLYENRLLRMLRKYDPQATVAHLAYQNTLEAPVRVKPADGVFLEFAPIDRNYAEFLSADTRKALEDNLKVFPRETAHILEYWLDESMFCRWKRDSLVPLPFDEQRCRRDINWYRGLGVASITTFATWLGGPYEARFGSADRWFEAYGRAFDNGKATESFVIGRKPKTVTGFHAPWSGLDDDTKFSYSASGDSLHFSFDVREDSYALADTVRCEEDINPEDRIELFFSSTGDMSEPYYCIEIDARGRVMDYRASYYRELDFSWTCPGYSVQADTRSDGYTVSFSVSRQALAGLGLDLRRGFFLAAFRDDFLPDGQTVVWYSRRATSDLEPDFHKPDILIPARVR